ncbi:uncharacterized protein LOC132205029 [Neocloeon triangulifer]|uniref:uncharacterized protein LOC132205029 n=1 Tax=Neocloeon triangulifer TaxID=2078957 RepID=UPI00286ECEF5|nr:uncharacterized protein LOC132205029 [Neocloeon triangulifer]
MHLSAKEIHVLVQQVLNNILQVRLEANWHQFLEQIKTSCSLEAIKGLHEKYLNDIQIYLLPEQMHELLNLTIELNDLFQSFMMAFKFPGAWVNSGEVGDEWNGASCSESSTTTPSKTVFAPTSVPRRLENLRSDFHELVLNFLKVVQRQPEEDMQNLYALVNLNNYYCV